MNYKCPKCNSKEFVTTPNKYDIFEVQNNKILFVGSESIDEEILLFCRNCSEKIEYNIEDITFDNL